MLIGGEAHLQIPNTADGEIVTYLAEKFGSHDYHLCSSGRSAMLLAIREAARRENITLWFPHYYCIDVLDWLTSLGYQIAFYHDGPFQDSNFDPPTITNGDIVFCVHYFGRINNRFYQWARNENLEPNDVIEDFTQSLWTSSAEIFGEHVVSSLRKWHPIPDGGIYLNRHSKINEKMDEQPSSDAIKFSNLRLAALGLRSTHTYRENLALDLFKEAEALLDIIKTPSSMTEISKLILHTMNHGAIAEQRKHNFLHLDKFFVERDFSTVKRVTDRADFDNFVPLFYAFLLRGKKREEVLAELKKANIFCPVIWPGIDPKIAGSWIEDIVCLPIDQRYGKKHMNHMCDILEKVFSK